MSAPAAQPSPITLPSGQERTLLLTLAAVQFTHVLDFMIMMPLGAPLMRDFGISPEQFSWLVAAYGLAAAALGFAGGFVLDRFDRKQALLTLFSGFGLATLACALAPTYETLLLARLAAGGFGGVAGSVVTAIVGYVIPPERRGRAMGVVMAAFPLASVAGVPFSLLLAGWFEWHAPFFFLAGLSVPVGFVTWRILPNVRLVRSPAPPLRQMREILSHRVHQRAFALAGMLVFSGGLIIPFMAPFLVANAGLAESRLPLVYLCGGACTFFTIPIMGRLADRYDKLYVLAGITVLSALSVIVLTNLPSAPLPWVLGATTLFFIGMSGRFAPTMAMVANAVEARYRGGFMSVTSSLQQGISAAANVIAGLLITRDPLTQRLDGFPTVGLVALGAFLTTLWLAARLRHLAPHAARNPSPIQAAPGPIG